MDNVPLSVNSRKMTRSIPAAAYLQAQIVNRAAKDGHLTKSVHAIETMHELVHGSLGNGVFYECQVVELLYCLIVLPKEIRNLRNDDSVCMEIEKRWSVKDNVTIELHEAGFWDAPAYNFIRHLRNAISHARFCFRNDRFLFWDRRNTHARDTFRATIAADDINNFLERVGALLANSICSG